MPVLEARTAFKRSSLIRKSATLPRSALHKQAPFSRLTVKAARPRLTSRVSQQKAKKCDLQVVTTVAPVWMLGLKPPVFLPPSKFRMLDRKKYSPRKRQSHRPERTAGEKKIHRKQRGFLRGTGKQLLPWAPRLAIALQLYGSRGLDVPNLGIILKSAHKTTRKRKSKNVLAT